MDFMMPLVHFSGWIHQPNGYLFIFPSRLEYIKYSYTEVC